MKSVTALTFVIGSQAAANVRRQLLQTRRTWNSPAGRWRGDAESLAEFVASRFAESPAEFEVAMPVIETRMIWRGREGETGILYVVQGEQLRTISLLLGKGEAPADLSSLAAVLSPINGFVRGLELVQTMPRPLI